MKIQPYQSNDKKSVLHLFDLNTPQYFSLSEREDLIRYLDEEIEDYFVVISDGEIVGAGGINYLWEQNIARISWDMIHPDKQGQGIGSLLTKHRLSHISKNEKISLVEVRTSQHTHLFYEKMGFELKTTEKDYWAPGFDLYAMECENRKT